MSGKRAAYALSSAPVDWHPSEALAVQLGGHLATILNATEHAWLSQTFGINMPQDTAMKTISYCIISALTVIVGCAAPDPHRRHEELVLEMLRSRLLSVDENNLNFN
jgi:hypothetical protein